MKPKIGIIGEGEFGIFLKKHLSKYFQVKSFNRSSDFSVLKNFNYIIFAVNYKDLESAAKKVKKYIDKDVGLIDVTSTKEEPLKLLKKIFIGYKILGTHPIFGPQSAKDGLDDLKIVLCNVSFPKQEYSKIKQALSQKFNLKTLEMTPKEHDKQMKYVQGLTHFIGRALKSFDLEKYPTSTKSYEHLLELKRILSKDSKGLFETIQKTNKETRDVRKKLIKAFQKLDTDLN